MRKPVDYLIANMAAADLTITIVYKKQIVSAVIRSYDWLIEGTRDNALCKIVPVLHLVSFKVSTFTLVFFSVERLLTISSPLRNRLTSRSIIITITRTWLVLSDLHLLPLHRLKLTPGRSAHEAMVCLVTSEVEETQTPWKRHHQQNYAKMSHK